MIPLTWTRDYPGSDRQVARLGKIMVGAVIVSTGRNEWNLWMPSEHGSMMGSWRKVPRSKDPEREAKACLTAALARWLADAGVLSLAERDRAEVADLPLFATEEQHV